MSQKTERLGSLIHELITPVILSHLENNAEKFWVVSVVKVAVSEDYCFADIHLSSQKNVAVLAKFLSKYSKEFKKIIWRKISIRKIPTVRFKIQNNENDKVYSLITKLSKQYGLN